MAGKARTDRENVRSATIHVRITPREEAALRVAAAARGQDLSDYLRGQLRLGEPDR